MTLSEEEIYEFDRQGYLIFKNFLTADEVARLTPAVDRLEQYAIESLPEGQPLPPQKHSGWGSKYHYSTELGIHCSGSNREGEARRRPCCHYALPGSVYNKGFRSMWMIANGSRE